MRDCLTGRRGRKSLCLQYELKVNRTLTLPSRASATCNAFFTRFRSRRTTITERTSAMQSQVERVKPLFAKPDWFLKKKRYNIRLRSEVVQEFLKGAQYSSILDIGCGDGSLSLPLLRPDAHITLLDISTDMLAAAQAQIPGELADNVRIVNGDFASEPFAPHSYDLIICVGVLAYVESLPNTIAKIAKLLKPGGTVITENTNSTHLLTRIYTSLARPIKSNYPITSVSSKSVTDLYDSHRFRLTGEFRYSLAQPGMGKVLSQDQMYRLVRFLHGSAGQNRNTWLANECMYCFQHAS